MLRRGRANPVIFIFIMLILVGAAIGLFIFYRNVATIRILPWLSEEMGSKPVLTMATLNVEPGQVYIVDGDIQGWQIKKKDTQLYEKLSFSGALSVNDVVVPHLFDWYFDGVDDYILGSLLSKSSFLVSINDPYGTLVARFVNYDTSRLVGASTPHTFIFGITQQSTSLYAFAISVYSPTKLQGYFRGLGHNGFTDLGYNTEDIWFTEAFSYSVYDANKTQVLMWIDGNRASLPNNGWYNYTDGRFGTDSPVNMFRIGWSGLNEPDEWFNGKVGYVMAFKKVLSDQDALDIENGVIYSSSLELFVSATFYNGSHYIDVINGVAGTPYGGVIRIPAENPSLFMIKNLASDNKVHFKWFPLGSTITIKDQYGNIIRKFTIVGTPVNQDNQIEDYAISLDATTIPQATIEAYVPSLKVRVYGPLGAIVEIVDENNVVVGSGKISGSYVDIPLLEPVSGKIVVYADAEAKSKLDVVVDGSENVLTVKVLDSGVPIPDLLVRIADPSGVVIGYDKTNSSGVAEFRLDRPLPEITIEVSGIWKGELIYLTQQSPPPYNPENANANVAGEKESLMLLGVGALFVVVAAVIIISRGRR